MDYFLIWIRKNIIQLVSFLVLLMWGITATYFAFENRTLLIEVTPKGTRVIQSDAGKNALSESESIEFIKTYLNLSYNFSPKNFRSRLGEASTLMSVDLWETIRHQVEEKILFVEGQNLEQSGKIQKITSPDQFKYQALVKVNQKFRAKSKIFQVKVSLKIQKTKRTQMNPWGIEVIEDKDEKI